MKRVKEHRYLYRRGEKLVFRRGVPTRARDAFNGRHEVVVSLKTKNLLEARFRVLEEQAKFEAVLDRYDREMGFIGQDIPKHQPTLSEIEEAVRLLFEQRMERSTTGRLLDPRKIDQAIEKAIDLEAFIKDNEKSISLLNDGPSRDTQWAAQGLIEKYSWHVPDGTELHHRLVRTIARGQIEAAKRELQDLNGEARKIVDHTFAPEQYRLDAERRQLETDEEPVPLIELFERYAQSEDLKGSTFRAWRRQIVAFVEFIGHNDSRAVSQQDVFAWKEHLLGKKLANGNSLSARTVRDTYLSAVKATYNWAIENAILEKNPATLVRIRKKKKKLNRSKGLTDEEAAKILRGTLMPMPARLTKERAFGRRWVPWFCAYSGARVNEITQLRAEDFKQIDGIWTFLITPEAGTVKNNEARFVPIHPHIIEQGFIEEIDGKSGPLFYNPARRRGGSDENPQPKKVGEYIARWVRELGVTDPDVQPNHGWRHRFKTIARRVKMDAETRDVIQGHAPRTDGEEYGETEIEVLFDAINSIPRYEL